MTMWLRKLMRKQDGLTLIELIVVVAIIAILAFTITPRVLDSLDNSRLSSARSVANEIHAGLERYYANIGTTTVPEYPLLPTAGPVAFLRLRTELANTVALTNTTANLFAGDAATPTFAYVQYENGTTGTYSPVDDGVANSTVTISYYCITFTARNRAATVFRITPAGILESPTNAACPSADNSALTAFN